jgi:hypothetical protein
LCEQRTQEAAPGITRQPGQLGLVRICRAVVKMGLKLVLLARPLDHLLQITAIEQTHVDVSVKEPRRQ